MKHFGLSVLLEDNHLLAVVKPANLPTMGVESTASSLIQQVRDYLRQKYHKPGNVYVGVVSRLDAAASGVLVLARTSKAARRLTEQFRTRSVRKTYWALVPAVPVPSSGTCGDWLCKREQLQRMVVCDRGAVGAQWAELAYRTLRSLPRAALLEINLQTGRKHQIRVQLAHRDMPILGDRKYGSARAFTVGIALHARSLRFEHPIRHETVELVAPVPACWHPWGVM